MNASLEQYNKYLFLYIISWKEEEEKKGMKIVNMV